MAIKVDSDTREILREAVAQGMHLARSKNHLVLKHPDGRTMTMSVSPSDVRAKDRQVSEFRKLGFTFRGRGLNGETPEVVQEVAAPAQPRSVGTAIQSLLGDGMARNGAMIVAALPAYSKGAIQDALTYLHRTGKVTPSGTTGSYWYRLPAATPIAAPAPVTTMSPPVTMVTPTGKVSISQPSTKGRTPAAQSAILAFLEEASTPQTTLHIYDVLIKRGFKRGTIAVAFTALQHKGLVVRVRSVKGRGPGQHGMYIDLASRHPEITPGVHTNYGPKRKRSVAPVATVIPVVTPTPAPQPVAAPAPTPAPSGLRATYLKALMARLEAGDTSHDLLVAIERTIDSVEGAS